MGQNDREYRERRSSKEPKRNSSNPKAGSTYTHRFVRIELNTTTKEQFRALLADGEFTPGELDGFLQAGYSVRFSPTDGGKTIVCTVSCSLDSDPNNGLMLTGRGGDASTALAVCAYKDRYLCENGAWASGEDMVAGSAGDIG